MAGRLVEVDPASVRVGKRHRRDLGDVDGLAASIRAVGLLHPPVVQKDMSLVAGRRRLEAVCQLGWATVPVLVVDNLGGVLDALRAERDENTCRKAFLPSEAVSVAVALEAAEREDAARRQREGASKGGKTAGRGRTKDAVSSVESCHQANGKAKTRDRVAEAVGMSGRTYEKAKAIVEAAERDPALRPLVARMDAEGKVDRVYRELQSRQPRPKPAAKAAPQQPPPPALDRLRCPVPPNLVPLFAEAGAAPELIASVRALNEVLGRVRGLLRRVPLVHLDGERFERLLREAAGCLADASPHCVCRDCEGKGCRACGGNGYWTRAEAEKRGVY